MIKDKLENIIECQDEYIKALERADKEHSIYLFKHGYLPDQKDVDEGVLLREKIRLAKDE